MISTVLLALSAVLIAESAGGAAGPTVDALAARVDSLSASGSLREALSLAQIVRDRREEAAEKSKPFEKLDARWAVATLERLLRHPMTEQERFLAARRMDREFDAAYRAGDFAKEASIGRERLAIDAELLGEQHPRTGQDLLELAWAHVDLGDTGTADSLARRAREVFTSTLGAAHPMQASTLTLLSYVARSQRRVAEAVTFGRQALDLSRDLLGEDSPGYARALNEFASTLQDTKQLAAADSVFERAVDRHEAVLGDSHEETAIVLANYALLLQERGRFAAAIEAIERSLQVTERVEGTSSARYGKRLGKLGAMLTDAGDFARAEVVSIRSLETLRGALGEEHADVLVQMNQLALLFRKQGRYREADALYRRCLAVRTRVRGPGDPGVTLLLNNLGMLAYYAGDMPRAQAILEDCLGRRRDGHEPEYDIAVVLHNLGTVLAADGRNAEAKPQFEEALAIRERVLGPDHWLTALTLRGLAAVEAAAGGFADAERLQERALKVDRAWFGEEHDVVARDLIAIATSRAARGDSQGAVRLAEDGLRIARRALGPGHPELLGALVGSGRILGLAGDRQRAEELFTEAAVVFEASRARVDVESRAELSTSPFSLLAGARHGVGDEIGAWVATESHLARGMADALAGVQRRSWTQEERAQVDSLRVALGDVERRLAALQRESRSGDAEGRASRAIAEGRQELLDLEAAWSRLHRDLAIRYPDASANPVPLDRVQAGLASHEAIVGWLEVEWSSQHVESWGYVIRQTGPVRWQELPPPRLPIAEWKREVRDAFRGHSGHAAERISGELWTSRLQPLEKHFAGARTLIVVPSDLMRGMPIEAIMERPGSLVSNDRTVVYAPSATIFTWLREQPRRAGTTRRGLFVGDPEFSPDESPRRGKESSLAALAASTSGFLQQLLRSAAAGDPSALESLPRLPATRQEVEACVSLFPGSDTLVGADATEDALAGRAARGELRQYGVLHVATHALARDDRPGASALVLSRAGLADPLEAALAGRPFYDGLVTADEIQREWTLDADLVALSGCETALGREISGEGFIGLASAFLRVGARSLLVSLWPVEDRSTALLMRRFYENWTGRYDDERLGLRRAAMSRATALSEAKSWLRTYRDRGTMPYAKPFHWAGFILVGLPD